MRALSQLQLEAMKQRLATVTEDKYNSEDKVIKLSDELEKKVFIRFVTIIYYLKCYYRPTASLQLNNKRNTKYNMTVT